MTEYGEEREQKRKQRSARWALHTTFSFAGVLLKLGPDVIVTGTRQGRSVVYSLYDNLGDRRVAGRRSRIRQPLGRPREGATVRHRQLVSTLAFADRGRWSRDDMRVADC